jgi:type II secretory pathway pseudopilin PulG
MKKISLSSFTMVELLVTISIIAILATMLLPAISKSMTKARSVMCVSNLRNIGTATISYLGDSSDYFPPTITTGAAPYFDAMENYTGIKAATSKLGIKGAGIYYCPADVFRKNNVADDRMRFSYGLNGYTDVSSSFTSMLKSGKIRNPGKLLYRADAGKFSSSNPGSSVAIGANSYPFNVNTAIDNDSYGAVDFRHGSSCSVLWLDMHCSSEKIFLFYGTTTRYVYQY